MCIKIIHGKNNMHFATFAYTCTVKLQKYSERKIKKELQPKISDSEKLNKYQILIYKRFRWILSRIFHFNIEFKFSSFVKIKSTVENFLTLDNIEMVLVMWSKSMLITTHTTANLWWKGHYNLFHSRIFTSHFGGLNWPHLSSDLNKMSYLSQEKCDFHVNGWK